MPIALVTSIAIKTKLQSPYSLNVHFRNLLTVTFMSITRTVKQLCSLSQNHWHFLQCLKPHMPDQGLAGTKVSWGQCKHLGMAKMYHWDSLLQQTEMLNQPVVSVHAYAIWYIAYTFTNNCCWLAAYATHRSASNVQQGCCLLQLQVGGMSYTEV